SRWMTADGEVHTAGAHCRVAVPTRVADAALRHGHAFPAESEAAQRILMIQGPDYAYHRPEHCVDLSPPKDAHLPPAEESLAAVVHPSETVTGTSTLSRV